MTIVTIVFLIFKKMHFYQQHCYKDHQWNFSSTYQQQKALVYSFNRNIETLKNRYGARMLYCYSFFFASFYPGDFLPGGKQNSFVKMSFAEDRSKSGWWYFLHCDVNISHANPPHSSMTVTTNMEYSRLLNAHRFLFHYSSIYISFVYLL